MASTSRPPLEDSPKRLAEFLQEQQEPFILELYLHERGYKRKSLDFEGSFGCLFSNDPSHKKSSEESTRKGRRAKRSTDAARYFTRIARDFCNKLVSIKEILRLKDCDIRDGKFNDAVKGRRKNEKEGTTMEESATLSSTSLSVKSNSCSGSDIEDMSNKGSKSQRQLNHQSDEAATDGIIQWRMIEENRQCSPVSVLDEIEAIPIYDVRSDRQEQDEPPSTLGFSFSNLKKATEESIFSASLWKLFINNRRDKTGVVGPSKSTCCQHINSKNALQQTRQLLFDCVREAVESQGRHRKAPHLIGPEELGKIICNNIRAWDKQSANGKKITKLLRSDFQSSYEQQDIFEGFKEEVVKEVGDKILEEIKDDMAEEIIDLYFCKIEKFC